MENIVLMFYPCCFVEEVTKESTLCWSCGKGKGWRHYKAFEELPRSKQPPRNSNSKAIIRFSMVLDDILRRGHP